MTREDLSRPIQDISLPAYRAIVSKLPPPSDEQIAAFIEFVSNAHSWYKHLPLMPPGKPFTFFVDHHVGCDRVVLPSGGAVYSLRTESTPQFHYTWMTTNEYRSRFGYLAYSCRAGQAFMLPSAQGCYDHDDRREVLCGPDGCRYRVPEEVLHETSLELTAVIHESTACVWVWERACSKAGDTINWPEETGGQTTLYGILEQCVRLRERAQNSGENSYEILDEVNPALDSLLAPERARLKSLMVAAIQRLRSLLYG